MKIQIKTWFLLVCFVGSVFLHFFDMSLEKKASLPSIPSLVKEDLRKIVITYPQETIVFEQQEEIWNITSPIQQKADYARLRAMFLQFRKEIPMDIFIEKGNGSQYGLDANHSITVEIWSKKTLDSQKSDIGFTLGYDTDGGTSYIHLQNDGNPQKSVYRARIGTRQRYDFPLQDWQNQILLDFSPIDIVQMDVQTENESYRITRSTTDVFEIKNATFDVDSTVLAKKITSLGQLRIGSREQRSLEEGSVATIILTYRHSEEQPSKKQQVLKIYNIENQRALVSLSNGRLTSSVEKEFFVVASSLLQEFLVPTVTFRNKKIFDEYELVKEAIDRISYTSTTKNEKVELQQDLSNGFWTVLQPSQKSLDMRKIFFMVNTLLGLEAIGIVENPTQEQKNMNKDNITLHLLGGDSLSIGLSQPIFMNEQSEMESQKYRFLYIKERIFVISKKDYVTIMQGFGYLE
jgi:hypothetical protein